MGNLYHDDLFQTFDRRPILFRVEVNQDIRSAVEAGNQPNEEQADTDRVILAGRRHALGSVGDFNDQTVQDILRRRSTESHWWNDVERLKNNTRTRVRAVLEGTLSGNGAPTPAEGVSDEFDDFVVDIFNESENAQNTIADTEFALQTLKTTQERLSQRLDFVRRRAHEQDRVFGKWWKPWGRASQEKAQGYFDARRAHVEGILGEIQGRIEERKGNTEVFIKEHSERILDEMQLMTPLEKAEFLDGAQREINSQFGARVARLNLGNTTIDAMMERLTLHQRIEVYKEAKLDQTVPNRNMEACHRDDERLKNDFNESAQATRAEVGNLEFNRIQQNLGMRNVEGADHMSSEFIREIEQALNDAGLADRSRYFRQFPDRDNLNDYQKFIVYCRIIQSNRQLTRGTSRGTVCDGIPRDLRRRIAEYLQFIQDEEATPDDELEGFTERFGDLEDGLRTQLVEFGTLMTGLSGIQNLRDAENEIPNINDRYAEIRQQINEYERQKDSLTEEERAFLDEKYESLRKALGAFDLLLGRKHDEKRRAFEESRGQFAEYTSQIESLEDQLSGIGTSRPDQEIEMTTVTRGTMVSETPTVMNQSDIDQWDRLSRELAEAESRLAGVQESTLVPAGTRTILNEVTYPYSFIDNEISILQRDILADFREIDADRVRPGRDRTNVRTNLDNPNLIFRNYLARKANETFAENVDETLETNRKKMLTNLKEKQLGSSVNLSFIEYQHGNPPTSTEVLSSTRGMTYTDCRVLFTTKTGVVLSRGVTDEILIVQEGEQSHRVEVISMQAPSGVNLETEGLPKGFSLGEHQSFVATPTSILAS